MSVRRDDRGKEIEAKPSGSVRPMSWGDRVERRKSQERAGKPNWIIALVSRLYLKISRLSRSLGMSRRRIEVAGVVYREKNNTSLRRALSATGAGYKEYSVRFPVLGKSMPSAQYPMRESMDIRYTTLRMFGDLGHEPRLFFLNQVSEQIKPGDRVLDIGCGTGAGSAHLAGLVGPSGGVVAIDRDGPSIRYARQRHRHDHLAFELGWLETLEGELDGGFDAVVAVDLFRDAPDEPSKSRAAADIWRLAGSGGVLVMICKHARGLNELTSRLEILGVETIKLLDSDAELGWVGALAIRSKSKPT